METFISLYISNLIKMVMKYQYAMFYLVLYADVRVYFEKKSRLIGMHWKRTLWRFDFNFSYRLTIINKIKHGYIRLTRSNNLDETHSTMNETLFYWNLKSWPVPLKCKTFPLFYKASKSLQHFYLTTNVSRLDKKIIPLKQFFTLNRFY